MACLGRAPSGTEVIKQSENETLVTTLKFSTKQQSQPQSSHRPTSAVGRTIDIENAQAPHFPVNALNELHGFY
jgi:hypothetical protein